VPVPAADGAAEKHAAAHADDAAAGDTEETESGETIQNSGEETSSDSGDPEAGGVILFITETRDAAET